MAVAWADCAKFGTHASQNSRTCQRQYLDPRFLNIPSRNYYSSRPSKEQVAPTVCPVKISTPQLQKHLSSPWTRRSLPFSDVLPGKAGTIRDTASVRAEKSQ
jgi:hypothetical protein